MTGEESAAFEASVGAYIEAMKRATGFGPTTLAVSTEMYKALVDSGGAGRLSELGLRLDVPASRGAKA